MTRDELRLAGETLHGPHWQTPLARQLGVAERTVRRWIAGKLPVGDSIAAAIKLELAKAGRRPLGEPVLQQVTMTTGNVVQSPRSGVEQGTMDLLRPMLREGRGVAAGIPFDIARRQPGSALLTIGSPPGELCGVCWDHARSVDGWAAMLAATQAVGMKSLPAEPPPVPWLAVTVLPGILTMGHEVIGMLGDMERCLAWGLIELGDY